MSSGFVSGGTTEQPIERDEEWRNAQQEIEANRRAKEELSRQNEGKTLYEVLQANKAAKQEAFEESIRLKNQFRSLDEDEIDFLDSVLESTRAKEEAVKKETFEKLELFRQQQTVADQATVGNGSTITTTEGSTLDNALASDEVRWSLSGRKRKRVKEGGILKGVKLRKSSSSNPDSEKLGSGGSEEPNPFIEKPILQSPQMASILRRSVSDEGDEPRPCSKSAAQQTTADGKRMGLGLAAYDSGED